MVGAGQATPGGLDRCSVSATRDAEHVIGIAFRHLRSVPTAGTHPMRDVPTSRTVLYHRWVSSHEPESPPRSPPRRSDSRIGSRSRTGRAPAIRAGSRRPSRRPMSAWRTSRCPSGPATSSSRHGSSRPRSGEPGPGVALIHGWESARDRTLPLALFLHAAGFHCLTIDIRGHGANPAEALPLSAGEFGLDASAAFEALIGRPEVTSGAIAGHSMGAIGAILAGAADPRVGCDRRDLCPGRPLPAHAADVPAGAAADPRSDRVPARLAHDPGLSPTAATRRRRDQRERRRSRDTRVRSC